MTLLRPISDPYLLIVNITCFKDDKGHHYVDPLWHKDLIEHTAYIENLFLACPCSLSPHPAQYLSLEGNPKTAKIKFVELPDSNSFIKSVLHAPITCFRLWKSIGESKIVHAGIGGWPIPLGWFAAPLAKIHGKLLIINVESAFWRIPPGAKSSWKAKVREKVSEILGRKCLQIADLPIFTTESYKRSLLPENNRQDLVIHASWIDGSSVISEKDAESIWIKKLHGGPLRILLASRLVPEKGVIVLLEAMKLLSEKNIPIELDIIGEGKLLEECCKAQKEFKGETKVNYKGTVEYGKQVYELLQNYHAVVVPNITDEQPRIVYDAYSQGVPLIASATDGLKDCITDLQTGYLVNVNDPHALAKLLEFSEQNRDALHIMGMKCIQQAAKMTHQQMHLLRHKLILDALKTERS